MSIVIAYNKDIARAMLGCAVEAAQKLAIETEAEYEALIARQMLHRAFPQFWRNRNRKQATKSIQWKRVTYELRDVCAHIRRLEAIQSCISHYDFLNVSIDEEDQYLINLYIKDLFS